MLPSSGLTWSLFNMCTLVLLMNTAVGKIKYGKGIKKFRLKDSGTTSTTESIVDLNEKWDPVRVLQRSKVLVHAYLKMHDVVPEIIPKAPRDAVEVVFANSIVVDFGNELWSHQIPLKPHRTVWPVEQGAYYTLVLFSPDIPSKNYPYEGAFLYWMVANIPDSCVTSSGTTYAEYISPKIKGKVKYIETDQHRFIFFVYKQPKGMISYDFPHLPSEEFLECRKFFNVTQLAEKYGLELPVAANLFQMTRIAQ